MVPSSGRHGNSCSDHGCRLGHMQRIKSIEFWRDLARKTFPYRRTYRGTQGRRSCDQIKGSEGMPEETTLESLNTIKGSPCAPSGVLRDVLLDVPRQILSRDESPFLPVEERPLPRNMKFSQDILKAVQIAGNCGATNIPTSAADQEERGSSNWATMLTCTAFHAPVSNALELSLRRTGRRCGWT